MADYRVGQSYFDGGMLTLIGVTVLSWFITFISLGILYPWSLCISYGWRINHTVVEGRRLKFIGHPIDLFFQWIKWFFLCIITLGIYGFWLGIALEKWKAKNTVFAN